MTEGGYGVDSFDHGNSTLDHGKILEFYFASSVGTLMNC